MHVSIHRYHRLEGATDGQIPAGRRLASAVSSVPGFVAYALFDAGDGVLISLSVFESRAELASADRLVAQWLWEESGGQPLGIRDVTTGEVIVQRGM